MFKLKHCVGSRCRRLASLAIFGLSLSSSVGAAIIEYKVEGIFDTDTLSGRHYSQTFRFDDVTRPGELGALPWETDILSYSLEVEGMVKHWTIEDWPLGHTFSQWIDEGGHLNSLAYLASSGQAGEPPAFVRYYDDGAPNSRSEDVKWYDWPRWKSFRTDSTDNDPIVTISAVPEPSSTALMLAALIGMIGVRRRNG